MKIKEEELKQIIKEELQAIMKEGHGLEGKMAQGQLRRISELANMIADQFDDGSNLEEWVEAKITKSQDYLSSVMNYMRGQSFPKARTVHTVKGDFPQLSEAVTPLAQAVNEVVEGVFERLGLNKDDHVDIAKYARGEAKELLSHEDADGKQMYLQPAKWGTVVAVVEKRVEKKYSLGEVQSDALTQQIAYDKRQKELEKAKKLKAGQKETETGLSALTPAEVADEILSKRAKPRIKFSKGGVMIDRVPVAKFQESLERIIIEELETVLTEIEEEKVYYEMLSEGETIEEAMYRGRKVKLNKPMRGDVKKSKVYVKNAKGNVVKVNFGDKKMKIKKSNPKRRKSFRARHKCKTPGPKWKARYWSCKAW
jgi:hypothetical protein